MHGHGCKPAEQSACAKTPFAAEGNVCMACSRGQAGTGQTLYRV